MDRQFENHTAESERVKQSTRQSPYASIVKEPRPQHQWDEFAIRHPKMSRSGRAKIFMPYDALKGFKEAVREKEALYEEKRQLSEEEKGQVNNRISYLLRICADRKSVGQPFPSVSIRYFTEVPLSDEDLLLGADPYVVRGHYLEVCGTVRKISQYERYVLIGKVKVSFDDIADITGSLFDEICDSYAE